MDGFPFPPVDNTSTISVVGNFELLICGHDVCKTVCNESRKFAWLYLSNLEFFLNKNAFNDLDKTIIAIKFCFEPVK